jgi:hypothetical protein
LESVPGITRVEYSSSVDAEYAAETGFAAIDIPVAITTTMASVATLIVTWISARPRKDKDTVPGVRLQGEGMSLVISHEVAGEHQLRVIKAFLRARVSSYLPRKSHQRRAEGLMARPDDLPLI